MYSNSYKKRISIFLLADLILNLVSPCASYALTVGAAAPEFTSFEPVDATSLVNPATGSFTYNLPLIELPGPEGGYPLSLFNHAGISPDQESSWTGLGWNLNPGAINRVVNGIPDDYSGQPSTVRDQWSGGTQYAGQVIIPYKAGTITIGGSWDTYQGFGIDYMSMGVGPLSLNSDGNLGLTATPWSRSIGKGIAGDASARLSVTGSINIRTGKTNVSTGVGIGDRLFNVGVSLSSRGGISPNVNLPSVGGAQAVNNNFGKISTKSRTIFNIGYARLERTRYWMDQSQSTPQYGIVNAAKALIGPNTWTDENGNEYEDAAYIPSHYGFDRYILPELSAPTNQISVSLPEAGAGPSFPAYDIYTVSGQGTGGSMQPYVLSNFSLFDQDKNNLSYLQGGGQNYTFNVKSAYHKLPANNLRLGFRMNGEFANAHTIASQASINLTSTGQIDYPISRTPNALGYTAGGVTPDSYNATTQQLAGSSHIEYFTNREITTGNAASRGFIGSARPINRSSVGGHDIQDVIGGFSVTKSDGITYHYALPVYTYDNHQYSINTKRGTMQRDMFNVKPYAYTWLLTSVTGPDYVDQNGNGVVDDADYGYWVGFMYGKWTDTYQFRHPNGENEYITDLSGTKLHAEGRKQLYYLDAAYTRTNTVLFVKSIKQDGLGVASLTKGGFGRITESDGSVKVSTPTLKLDKVLLINNETLKVSPFYATTPAGIDRLCSLASSNIQNANVTASGSQLLTLEDMAVSNIADSKIIRGVEMEYDYSLCPQTLNSLAMNYNTNPATVISPAGGKLTLKAVRTFGKGNVSLIPATRFEYDTNPHFATFSVHSTQVSGLTSVANVTFNSNGLGIGDIVHFTYLGTIYYAVLTKLGTSATNFDITLLNKAVLPGTAVASDPIPCQTTKNPPYVKHAYDSWNLFKSDYIDFTNSEYNNDIARMTSEVSAKGVDAWSLRKIITPLGGSINVGYESGNYNKVGVKNPRILNIKPLIGCYYKYSNTSPSSTPLNFPSGFAYKEYSAFSPNTSDRETPYAAFGGNLAYFKLYVEERNVKYLLQQNFQIGDWVEIHNAVLRSSGTASAGFDGGGYSEGKVRVIGLGDDYIIVADPNQLLIHQSLQAKSVHFASFVELPKKFRFGGIRANTVAVEDESGVLSKTTYEYVNGVTSYEPLGYDGLRFTESADQWHGHYPYDYANVLQYKNLYRALFSDVMALGSELPDPGIIYSTVKKRQIFGTQPTASYEQYEFQVFTTDMVKALETKYITTNANQTLNSQARTIRIEDRSALLGELKRYSIYDNTNNLLSETRHELSTNADEFASQGRFEQIYHEERIVTPKNEQGTTLPTFRIGTVNIKAQYPAILKNTINIDYKTGIQTTAQTTGYDFLSGEATSQVASDGYGNRYLTESMPAYRHYNTVTGRPSMGPKFQNIQNRNMLVQNGSSYTYKIDNNGTRSGVVAAEAQTWSDNVDVKNASSWNPEDIFKQSGIWRKQTSFAWLPAGVTADGTTPMPTSGATNQFIPYNFQSTSRPPFWQPVQETTLYSVYSSVLESKDLNGNYAAQKTGNKGAQVFIAGSPASYEELAYTGAEESLHPNNSFTGNVFPRHYWWDSNSSLIHTDIPSTGKTHTGTRSVSISGPNNGIMYEPNVAKLDPTKAYRASMWVNSLSGVGMYCVVGDKFHGVSGKSSPSVNGWYLLTIDIPPIGPGQTYMRVGVWNGSNQVVYADDFRFQPANAKVNSYVYDQETGRLTDVLDNNNLATHYEYDAHGRVKKVYSESFEFGRQLVSEQRYNFARNQRYTVQASLNGAGQLASSLSGGLINQLELGGEVRYTVTGTTCQDKFELSNSNAVVVDGVAVTTDRRLADGTYVRRLANGCILSNVRSAHTVTIGMRHYEYDAVGTRYYLGCETCPSGGYTGRSMYKQADGCGGLLPAADDEYYTQPDASCNSGSGTVFDCPMQAAKTQPYQTQLRQVKSKASKVRVVSKGMTTKIQ